MFLSLKEKTLFRKVVFAGWVLLLVAGLLLVNCDTDGSTSNAEAPVISDHPQSGTFDVGDGEFELTVTANVTDGGSLSFKWYSNTTASNSGGTLITGQTSATLTLAKANYTENKDYYFYVVITNTNNAATGTKTVTATSNAVTVTVSGNETAPDPEATYTTAPIPEALLGTWVSDFDEEFIIAADKFTSSYDGEVGYEGTIIGHRLNGSAGYITIKYTTAYNSDNVGNFYVIHYKDLTATTVLLAGAGNESDLGDGKATQTTAEAAYTVTGGYFGMYSDCTKDSGSTTTITYSPTDAKFTEIMAFFAGEDDEGWMSYDAYVIHKWSDFVDDHWNLATDLFPEMTSTRADLKTYSGDKPPVWQALDADGLRNNF